MKKSKQKDISLVISAYEGPIVVKIEMP